MLGVLFLFPAVGWAQSTYDLFGSAKADGLAQATTAAPSARGPHANPAAHGPAQASSAAFYAQEPFGMSVLRYGAVGLSAPFQWGTLIGGGSTFGFEDYREIHYTLGAARGVSFGTSRSVYLGLVLRYHHTRIAGYGRAGGLALNPGLLVKVLPSLHLGAHATNINGSSLTEGEPLPRTLALGVQYRAHDTVRILVDLFKDVVFPATARVGLEARPVDAFVLRAGGSTAPTRFSAGIGVALGPLEADLAAQQHQQLGWSPSASLRFDW